MKKKIYRLIMPIVEGTKQKKNTNNVHQFVNKIPCDAKKLYQPSEAVRFVNEEMRGYPFSRKTKSAPKISKKIKESVEMTRKADPQFCFVKLSLKLEKKLSFLEIQELRELLTQTPKSVIKKISSQLRMLAHKIKYKLKTEDGYEDHVVRASEELVKQIHTVLEKKSNKVV